MTALRKSGRRKGSGRKRDSYMGKEKDGRGTDGRTDGERRRNQQPLAASTWAGGRRVCEVRGVLNYAATLELTCRHVYCVQTGSRERQCSTRARKCDALLKINLISSQVL